MDKNQLGIQYMQEGNYEEAAKAFSEAIEENPNDEVAFINFGNVLAAVGEMDRAHSFYQKAMQMNENAAAAYYSAGSLYYRQEQYEKAKEMFDTAIKKGLDHADAFFMLGMSINQLSGSRLALPYLQRSLELNEEDLEARFQYALCLAQAEVYDEAIKQFEWVIMKDENHADSYYNLGVAFAGYKEDIHKALEMFQKALDVQPDHILSAHAISLLENQLGDKKS